jgi:hypothetical protein
MARCEHGEYERCDEAAAQEAVYGKAIHGIEKLYVRDIL